MGIGGAGLAPRIDSSSGVSATSSNVTFTSACSLEPCTIATPFFLQTSQFEPPVNRQTSISKEVPHLARESARQGKGTMSSHDTEKLGVMQSCHALT